MRLRNAQQHVSMAMANGMAIDDVDREIIEPSGLEDLEKAALWLLAFHMQPRRVQRAFVDEALEMFAAA